ncbi:MAG: glycerophosphodiester phosphodiesterase family protein [Oceanococcus sp.]
MRLFCVFTLCLTLAACGSRQSDDDAIPLGDLKTDQVIVAHRGASGHAPEHTLVAYDLAIDMGTEYIEQDVLPTADGVLVCIHDDTLDRTARGPAENCTGTVSSKTLAQLKTCDMGSWFNEAYPERARQEYVGLQMLTLEEVFQRYGTERNYYIEIKPNTETTANVEQVLLDLIKQYDLYDGMVQRRQVLVQSFIPSSLLIMNALDPQVPLVQLSPGATALSLPVVSSYAFGIGPTRDETNALLLSEAHALGLAVHPYTANGEEDLIAMAQLCVDGVFTNFPDRYRQVLAANDYGCPAPIR